MNKLKLMGFSVGLTVLIILQCHAETPQATIKDLVLEKAEWEIPSEPDDYVVKQVTEPIQLDGKLEDWNKLDIQPF